MRDDFRPRHEPARTIYDALLREAEHRNRRTHKEWLEAETQAVWKAARDYAQQHSLRVPTIADVHSADRQGCGHIDYAVKVAYALASTMTKGD